MGKSHHLDWTKKLNDGQYDQALIKTLKSYFNKGLFSRLHHLSPDMAQTIVKDASKKLGDNWQEHVRPRKGNDQSVLTVYTDTHFRGKPIIANIAFIPMLKKINAYAAQNQVALYITNSYRPPHTRLTGTVVPPAEHSNHKIGHAIDMNLYYGDRQHANSTYMQPSNEANWAAPVKGFLTAIRQDRHLRWGGDFHSEADPVHIDDGFNVNHSQEAWQQQYELCTQAYLSGNIKDWAGA